MQYVLFQVGEEKYALPVSLVQSIEVLPVIRPVPKPPAHVVGVANLRGVITTILDTSSLLGGHQFEQTESTRIVVTETGAYIVDTAYDVVEIDESELEAWEGNSRVQGVWSNAGELILVLDTLDVDEVRNSVG